MIKLGELDSAVCIQCGEKAYEYKGKIYKLCSECGWEALKLMGYVDNEDKTAEEKVTEVIGYENFDINQH
jgi:ribosomal protein L37E